VGISEGGAIRIVTIWGLCLYVIALLVVRPEDPYPKVMRLHATPASLSVMGVVITSRWFGSPGLWQAPASDATVYFYDVKGSSQSELEDSMLAAKICDRSWGGAAGKCLSDPAVPFTGALALEGAHAPAGQFCYSPRSFALRFDYFIVLPRWTPFPDSVAKNTVLAWNALLPVFWTHETRHLSIAERDTAQLNAKAQTLASCQAVFAFWSDPDVFAQLNADQNAYHAQLRADCRPELGCVPYGWMGW
jgi:uncharacterized protein DUF922